MGVIITGTMLGQERRNGTLDNGSPWSTDEVVLLDGISTIRVRVEKFEGAIPQRGEDVAIECEHRNGRFHGTRRVQAVEDVLSSASK